MLLHPAHTWHGRLMPLWARGWLAIADLDLRTRAVYDLHVAALALLALAAAAMDRQLPRRPHGAGRERSFAVEGPHPARSAGTPEQGFRHRARM